ncbi:hypothetical protein [Rhodanobacter ginsengiterrae]|uniref:hypothetical protein n=1 Tax=Rhodanobacter ginsengiterrae TaxID=2008451 RepID=UPI003CFAA5AD
MVAHRKPSNVLQLSGAFAKNPQRTRTDPTPRGPIGSAPKQAPITFRKAWDLIVKACPEGVLADRDRLAVEIAASLFQQFRAAPAEFPAVKLARLQSLLADLGMTPAAASRVTAAPKPQRNDFDD